MPRRSGRNVGDEFISVERRLLTLLCSGSDSASAVARAQVEASSWGGYSFDDCGCFLIQVEERSRAQRIPHDGGPFVIADVEDGDDSIGMLELWVVDGLLHSVDFMPWGDDHRELPDPDRYRVTVVDAVTEQKG